MKIRPTNLLPALFVICCLAGRGAVMAEAPKLPVQKEAAYEGSGCVEETAQELSKEELEQKEKERRERIAEHYFVYQRFGLSYDKDKDRFMYYGSVVRYFSDPISQDHTNAFFYKDGVVDLKPVRNASGQLTGLEVASSQEFAARAKRHDEAEIAMGASGIGEAGCYEGGDPALSDDSLERYSEFGVSYNEETKNYLYEGKDIYYFYDPNGMAYINYGVTNGVAIKVVRGKNHKIEKIVRMTVDEIKEAFQ